ncbi:MAG: bifunctional 5,10-methylenetetrahydrofolate dehydrogenase/5,10-methenyltetrahydrofolate cyclohydrolase [Phycisphaerae bacterium]
MPARILDGNSYAAGIRGEVARDVAEFEKFYGPIKLASILVGGDAGARLYCDSQKKRCEQVGIDYELLELSAEASQDELLGLIQRLNKDEAATGIMLQMPLPPHMDSATAQNCIDPYKDVEGVSPANIGMLFYGRPIIAPCTALAIQEVLQRSGTVIRGAEACVIGQSRIVGKPTTMFLLSQSATVTACHIDTRDTAAHARKADIVIVAIGKPRAIGAEYIKPGAVVIDVGINSIMARDASGKEVRRTVGDVDFDAVVPIAGAITPVPGGVGPLTVVMLLRNLLEAARKQRMRPV